MVKRWVILKEWIVTGAMPGITCFGGSLKRGNAG
jgi:hypothetical protein